jgi:hypothetical protein
LLHDDGTADGFDRAVEHYQKAVTRILDELTLVLCDGRLDEFASLPHHARVRPFLIDFHKTAIS